jgi:predicted nucleic acid-binding protein
MIRVAERYLVDTGVFVRWYLRQPGWEHAQEIRKSFLDGQVALATVECSRFELAEVLRRKGFAQQRLTMEQLLAASRSLDDLGVFIHNTDADAIERAARLAATRQIRTFDALFVDRAMTEGLPLLTSDARLTRAVDDLLPTELLRGSQVE